MKNFNRWLSILMCLCMLGTSMLGDVAVAFAEEQTAVQPPEAEENAAALPEAEPEYELGGDEPVVPDDSQPQQGAASSAVNSDAPVSASADFTFGYAKLLDASPLYDDSGSQLAVLSAGGIVLVVQRSSASGSDRVKVAFVYGNAIEEGWVDTTLLRPMAQSEIDAFQDGITEALCYQDNVEYPLAEVGAEVATAPTQEPASTAVSYTHLSLLGFVA